MATYKINTENTGLATDEQAKEAARILSAAGHDVEFTRDFGLVNSGFDSDEDRTWTDSEWEAAIAAADEAFPA
ncbi:MAG TPA: hypothetical protein DDZ22_17385 [Massilia sp.]|nr:hypothetical protein [Massilia sp.]